MIVSLFVFGGIVFADGTAPASPPLTQAQMLAMMWPALGLAIATIGSYLTRKLSAEYTFFHTGAGAVVLGVLGSIISSVTPILQSSTVTWIALVWAAIGGVTSFFAALNPSSTKDDPPAKSPLARPGSAANPPPPPIRAGALLPLLLIPLSLLIGCPAHISPNVKAFGAAYGTCMEAKGIAVAPSVAEEAWNDLNNGSASAVIVGQLEALAGKAGQDAVTCAVQAWLGSATTGAKNPAGVEAAKTFLGKSVHA